MIENIQQLDKEIFLWLNSLHSPFWDQFFLNFTNAKSWIPVILVMLFLLFKKYGLRRGIILVLLITATAGLADHIASGIFKPYFGRLRPCHNFPEEMKLVGRCGGLYSFASSHAANSFALFVCFSKALFNNRKVFWFMLFWAVLMSYSRIYVGVHYPGDLIIGALIGTIVSIMSFYVYNKIQKTQIL